MTTPRLWQIHWSARAASGPSGLPPHIEMEPTTVRLTGGSGAELLSPISLVLRPPPDAAPDSFTAARVRLDVSAETQEGVLRLSLGGVYLHPPATSIENNAGRSSSAPRLMPVAPEHGSPLDLPLDPAAGKRPRSPRWRINVRLSPDAAAAPAPAGIGALAAREIAETLDDELGIELVPDVRPLTLIHDIDVPACRSVNLLGNFDGCFSETTAADEWRSSDDGALLHRSGAVAVSLGSACHVQLFENDRCAYDREEADPAGVLDLPLRPLPHGEHVMTVRATGAEALERTEEVRVQIKAEQATFANLPVARRFVKGVDVADGHLVHSATDLSIKAAGLPLEFVRTYSNLGADSRTAFPLGYGWTHNYHSWAERLDSNYVLVVGGEGSGKPYHSTAPGETGNGLAGYHGSLVETGGAFELSTPAGVMYRYAAKTPVAGRLYLESVRDPNGNQVKLTYSARGLLDRVTDASGSRHLRLTYLDLPAGSATAPLLATVEAYDGNTSLGLRVEFTYTAGHLVKAQRAARVQAYTYSAADARSPHRMLTATDADGGIARYTYKAIAADASADPLARLELERVVSVEEPGGRTTRLDYALERRPLNGIPALVPIRTHVFAAGGGPAPVVYSFDPERPTGTVIKIEQPGAPTTEFTWRDMDRLLAQESDGSGRVLEYDYSGPGNLVFEQLVLSGATADYAQILNAQGQKIERIQTRYAYGRFNHVDRIARADISGGASTVTHEESYQYDQRGNVLQHVEPEGRTTTFTYDARGNVLTKTRTDGEQTAFGDYTPHGQPGTIRRRIADGREMLTRQTFDPRGRMIATQDEVAGAVIRRTETTYDDLDQPAETRESYASGLTPGLPPAPTRVTQYVHSPGGLKKEERDTATGFVRRWTHDLIGRVTAIQEWPRGTAGDVLTRRFEYDAQDRITLQVDRRGIGTRQAYDTIGRPTVTSLEWTSQGRPQTVLVQTLTYWGLTNNVRTVTDHQGNRTESHYDTLFRVVSRTLPSGDRESFRYDSLGNVLSQTDASGVTTTFEYDRLGRKTKETDPLGNVRTFGYDRDGKLVRESDVSAALDRETQYDGLGRTLAATETLRHVTPPTVYTTRFAYDDARRILRTTRPTGAIVDEYRDGRELAVKRVLDPAGVAAAWQFTYNALGALIEERDPVDGVRAHSVDGLGRRLATKYDLDLIESFEYDGEGKLVARTDRTGVKWTTSYDARGRIVEESVQPQAQRSVRWRALAYDDGRRAVAETDAAGAVTTTEHDGLGREITTAHSQYPNNPIRRKYKGLDLAGVSDARGNWTTYEYDGRHRVTLVRTPIGDVTRTQYLDAERRVIETDRGGLKTETHLDSKSRTRTSLRDGKTFWTRTYDGEDRVVTEMRAGDLTSQQYDGAGRLTQTTLPGGRVVRYGYDRAGNRTEEYLAGETGRPADRRLSYDKLQRLIAEADAAGNTTRFEYDGEGRQTAVVDAEGLRTEYRYDHLGKLTAVVRDPAGVNALYEYRRDALGRVARVIDPTGRAVELQYDQLGRQTLRAAMGTDGARVETRTEYDPDGHVTALVRADGSRVDYTHDAAGRMASAAARNDRQPVKPYAASLTYAYDKNDNLFLITSQKVMSDGVAPTVEKHQLWYDTFNRATVERSALGPTFWSTYDDKGRVVKLLDFENRATAYTFNGRDRLVSVDGPLGRVEYVYSPDDRLQEVRMPEGHRTRYTRLPNGWVTGISHVGPNGTPLVEYHYTLNKVGDVLQVEAITPEGREVRRFGHDRLHRLSEEQYEGGAPLRYEYDKAGRRTASYVGPALEYTWTYDSLGRLVRVANAKGEAWILLAYTATGQVRERWAGGSLIRLWYNAWQQLAVAQWGSAPGLGAPLTTGPMTISYDYLGRRLARFGQPGYQAYVYTGQQRLADLQSLNQRLVTETRYERGVGLIGVASPAADGSLRRWLTLRDRAGSVTRLAGLSAVQGAAQEFSAFGALLKQESGGVPAAVSFGGGWTEPMSPPFSPLVHLGDRIYDTVLGRFWGPDPAQPVDTADAAEDPYVYAHNRPTAFVDPAGLWPSFTDDDDLDSEESDEDFDREMEEIDRELDERSTPKEKREWKEIEREVFGDTSSSQDGTSRAPSRPDDTSWSLKPDLRSVESTPTAVSSDVMRYSEATVTEPRSSNQNLVEENPVRTGVGLVGAGLVSLGIGAAILAGPVGVLGALAGGLLLSTGIAETFGGLAYLGASSTITPSQNRANRRAIHDTFEATSSMGGMIGSVTGAAVGGESGMRRGATIGAITEAAVTFGVGVGELAYREGVFSDVYRGSSPEWTNTRKAAIREAYGLANPERAATRVNTAMTEGVERLELSHTFLTRNTATALDEALGTTIVRRVANRPWNNQNLWSVEHYMIDESRRLPAALEAITPKLSGVPRIRLATPDWATRTAYGVGQSFRFRLSSEEPD